MNQVVEGVVSIVAGLKKKDKALFLEKLLADKEVAEDLYDVFLLRQRRFEPTRPFAEFEKELKSKGKLR